MQGIAMKMRVSIRFITFLGLSFVFAAAVTGQDLGSSNKLFGGGSKTQPVKTKKATAKPKKAPVKAKSSSPKPKTTAKRPAVTSKKPAKNSQAVVAPKTVKDPITNQAVIAPKIPHKEPQVIIAADTTPVVIGTNSAANDERFEELIDEGNVARDERLYTRAESAYQRANKLKPRDARALLGLGNLYSDQQRWEDAERVYRASLALEPDYVELLVALSFIMTRPVAASNLSERYTEGEVLARKAIKLDPQSALAADQLGVALELNGQNGSETEAAYRRSIQLDSSFAPAYAHLGRLLRQKGNTKASEAAYAEAFSRAESVGAKLLVADVLQSEGKFAESVSLLERALDADPRNPTALTMIGRALTTQGKFVEAERYLQTSISVSPASFISYNLIGVLFARQNKLELAENYFIQALRYVTLFEKRRLATQFESLGDSYVKAGRSAAASRSYIQAKTLDPERETLAAKIARTK